MVRDFENPFRPGAGHRPPYLAGRAQEIEVFRKLLAQRVVLENLVVTGLRGVGKTVLLDTLKPLALREQWLWVGADLSESASLTEERLMVRLLTDVSLVVAGHNLGDQARRAIGFGGPLRKVAVPFDFQALEKLYRITPGLPSDKLKHVLELVWDVLQRSRSRGVVFAYDEAQTLSDEATPGQFPTALMLDVFQSLQRKEIPFLLVFAGLPTLLARLVEARTFAERMFRTVFLDRLPPEESRQAILKPISQTGGPIKFGKEQVSQIIEMSGGYPYFIQFICREGFDALLQGQRALPVDSIVRKLDTDFFSGRWARATDRQQDLLRVIAGLATAGSDFTVQQIVVKAGQGLSRPFSPSHVNQMLSALTSAGLVYKNSHGRYSFAVPLMEGFINRQIAQR